MSGGSGSSGGDTDGGGRRERARSTLVVTRLLQTSQGSDTKMFPAHAYCIDKDDDQFEGKHCLQPLPSEFTWKFERADMV
uniref:Uncharacterized protein n=1 Tax=Vespula pensylvanica TaxID=30213 RepID=A0A834PFP6_VESPE|nr:hypothetical protein H0235_001196 [Vespula pensylvanica]